MIALVDFVMDLTIIGLLGYYIYNEFKKDKDQ